MILARNLISSKKRFVTRRKNVLSLLLSSLRWSVAKQIHVPRNATDVISVLVPVNVIPIT